MQLPLPALVRAGLASSSDVQQLEPIFNLLESATITVTVIDDTSSISRMTLTIPDERIDFDERLDLPEAPPVPTAEATEDAGVA